jgi:hypothetical protein
VAVHKLGAAAAELNHPPRKQPMPTALRFASTLSAVLLAAFTLALPAQAQTAPAAADPMPGLRGVMQLGRHMQAVAGAISAEDWAEVARLAPQIAEHPEPPLTEKVRVLTWLGTDAVKFRGLDQQAPRPTPWAMWPGAATAAPWTPCQVQQACLACHQGYRASFRQHFK